MEMGANTVTMFEDLACMETTSAIENRACLQFFVLNTIHILLDFSRVDFQCMLEELGFLLLIPGSIRFCVIHA